MQRMGQHMHLGIFPAHEFAVEPNFFSFERHDSSFAEPELLLLISAYSTCLPLRHQVGQKKATRSPAVASSGVPSGYNTFFKSGAGLKATVRLALMVITSPVWGLIPLRALRARTVKVPKPGT